MLEALKKKDKKTASKAIIAHLDYTKKVGNDLWHKKIFESHDFKNKSLEFKKEYFCILLDCHKFTKHIDIRNLCKRLIYKSLYKIAHFISNKYDVNIEDDELHFCTTILFSVEHGVILNRQVKQLALEHVVLKDMKDNMYVLNSFTEEDIKYIMENFSYDRNNNEECTNNVINILYTKFQILKEAIMKLVFL